MMMMIIIIIGFIRYLKFVANDCLNNDIIADLNSWNEKLEKFGLSLLPQRKKAFTLLLCQLIN